MVYYFQLPLLGASAVHMLAGVEDAVLRRMPPFRQTCRRNFCTCGIIPWGFSPSLWHPVVSFRFTCNRTSRCDSRAGSCADFISVRYHSVSHHSFGWIIGAFVSARLARRAYAITGDGASKRIRPRFVAANWFHQYDTFCRHLCMVVVVRVCAFDLALLV